MNAKRGIAQKPDPEPFTEGEAQHLRLALGQIMEDRVSAMLRECGLPHDYVSEVISLFNQCDVSLAAHPEAVAELRRRAKRLIEHVRLIEDPCTASRLPSSN